MHKMSSLVTGSSQLTTLTNYGWIHVTAVWTYDPSAQVCIGSETQPKGWDRGKVKSYSLIFSAQHGVGNQRESRRLGRKREDGREGRRECVIASSPLHWAFFKHGKSPKRVPSLQPLRIAVGISWVIKAVSSSALLQRCENTKPAPGERQHGQGQKLWG